MDNQYERRCSRSYRIDAGGGQQGGPTIKRQRSSQADGEKPGRDVSQERAERGPKPQGREVFKRAGRLNSTKTKLRLKCTSRNLTDNHSGKMPDQEPETIQLTKSRAADNGK